MKLHLFLILFLILPLAIAQPPMQQTTLADVGLEIIYPQIDVYAKNPSLVLNYMVVNSSGYVLNASAGEVLCWFGLQNESNNILILEISPTNNYFFSQVIPANSTGLFSYEIHCNSTTEWGFLANHYYITDYNKHPVPGESPLSGLVIIAAVFALSYLLLYLSFNLDKNKHTFLQLIIVGFVIGISILIPKSAMDYAMNYNTSLTLFKSTTWFVRIFWVYMFFYIMYEFLLPLVRQFRTKRKW